MKAANNLKDIQHRIEAAREAFILRSKPYFDELAKVHAAGLRGYERDDDGNLIPIYTEATEVVIRMCYEHIEHIKLSVMQHYELGPETLIPTITKPVGY